MDNLAEMYKSGMSIPAISAQVGISRSTVRLKLIKMGVAMRSRADGVRAAASEGRLGSGMRGKNKPLSAEHKKNISKARVKWANENAKGFSLKPNGYLEHTTGPNKGRLLHVTAMESFIGRALNPDECVHHIDECKTNNEISNLALMTKSAHVRLHRLLDEERGIIRERDENGRFC